MDLRLQGLKAIVTGGTKGIGRAIVETLAAEGVQVAFCARNGNEVAAAASVLQAGGARVAGSVVDVADAQALQAWVDSTGAAWGGIDIVVANVSAMAIAGDDAAWQRGFDVDMMGTVRLVNAVMPHLERSAHASIVTIASVSGREIDLAAGPYGAFKAAIAHYTQGLARQLAGKGIRANTVSPGNTYFADGIWTHIEADHPAMFAEALASNPMGRMATPQEIADAVVFMASPRASFVSGANLRVDGALTRGVQL